MDLDTTATDSDLAVEFRRTSDERRRRVFYLLYEHHAGTIQSYLLRLAQCRHLAEDLTQESFLRAWNALNDFDGRCAFRSWVYGIATNLFRDHLRMPRRDP